MSPLGPPPREGAAVGSVGAVIGPEAVEGRNGSKSSGYYWVHSGSWRKLRRNGFGTLTKVPELQATSSRFPTPVPSLSPEPHPICKTSCSWDAGFDALHVFSALPVHKFMIALLEAKHQDICFAACGVLLNLTVDKDKRAILKEGGGIKK